MQGRQGEAAMGTVQYASNVQYQNAQAVFYQQYEAARRDEVVGILLALFLGTFGIHHFYLRRTGLGILYCFLFWTGIPAILGFFECFFMPGRVREYNAIQAAGIAAALGMAVPPIGWPVNVTVNMPPSQGMPPASAPVAGPGGYAPVAGIVAQPNMLVACGKCQTTNAPGSRFCASCGSPL
jgi:TM2 domain-containing membrane protein YozV